jgi:hypothetical protein
MLEVVTIIGEWVASVLVPMTRMEVSEPVLELVITTELSEPAEASLRETMMRTESSEA